MTSFVEKLELYGILYLIWNKSKILIAKQKNTSDDSIKCYSMSIDKYNF